METLEPRLTLTWAGIPPVTISPAVLATPATINVNGFASGIATIADTEVDYYAFTATVGGNYTFTAATPASSLDTVIGVFTSTGTRVAFNDNISGTNNDSRVAANLVEGQRYLFGVTNFIATSRGSYNWIIQGPSVPTTTLDDIYEENDTHATAYDLGTLVSSQNLAGLQLADSDDWFKFTTTGTSTAGSSVSISFQNSEGNLQLGLYAENGSLLATSAGVGNIETILLNGRPAGTYFVRVYGSGGAMNPNYTLAIVPPVGGGGGSNFHITLEMEGLTAGQQAIFHQAAARWSEVIIGDLPNATYLGTNVDDVLIHASAVPIDGVNGILGQAGPDTFRSNSLPIHGIMQFDTADMAAMEANGTLMAVVLHEMGHVLGVGTIWQRLGLLTGAGTTNPLFVGAQATAAYNQIFGTAEAGVPVENMFGPGTRDAHWRESILTNELMTGFTGPGNVMPLSRITVASMADMGYTVNIARADPFTPTIVSPSPATEPTGAAAYVFARKLAGTHGDALIPSAMNALPSSQPATATVSAAAPVEAPLAPRSTTVFDWSEDASTARDDSTPSRVFTRGTTWVDRDALDIVLTTSFQRETRPQVETDALAGDAQVVEVDDALHDLACSPSEWLALAVL